MVYLDIREQSRSQKVRVALIFRKYVCKYILPCVFFVGKIRLLYEANPLALVLEEAGGAASSGMSRILDISLTVSACMYVCIYVCMYICYGASILLYWLGRLRTVQYLCSTASIHTSRNVWSGLYTDDVQLLHKTFLIYDQCTYSPLNRYRNFYYRTPTISPLHQDLSICMYVYICI